MLTAPAHTPENKIDQADNAGNPGDVLKHAVLAAVLAVAAHRRAPLFYLETHAGRGKYLVPWDEARRHLTVRLPSEDSSATAPYTSALRALLRPSGSRIEYPGSPLIAAHVTRGVPVTAVLYESDPVTAQCLDQVMQTDGARAGWRARVNPASVLQGDEPRDFRSQLPPGFDELQDVFPVLLMDPFGYSSPAPDTDLDVGRLNRSALARAGVGLRKPGVAPDGLVLVWTYQSHAELARDLAELVRGPVDVAAIYHRQRKLRYHMAVAALGVVGREIIDSIVGADWLSSPLLSTWGFEISFEREAR